MKLNRNLMKPLKLSIVFLFVIIGSSYGQITSGIFSGNINDVTDEQLSNYYEQAKSQGYTIEQIKAVASAKGVSDSDIAKLENRLKGLMRDNKMFKPNEVQDTRTGNALDLVDELPSGLTGNEIKQNVSRDSLFGYDFFNNTNISFSPNLNLATPANYQLGPGDEIAINLYGAAEYTYDTKVDRQGAIRLQNIGPVYVNGLTIEAATGKIESALRRIYSGISAPDSSPYKVFVGVALSKVRTVQVNIIGDIKVPGTYSLSSLSTVLNALYASGGPTRDGTFRDIKLVRNGKETANFDIYKFLVEGSQEGNTTVQDQDVIIVGPYISRVMISGAIKRPGIYELRKDETLTELLNYASGFTSTAYRDRLVLERIEGDRRVVKEINTENAGTATLKDGDELRVNSIIDKFINRISIDGAVYYPGNYELTPDLTLLDLINKSSGLTDEAFLDRGLLIRTEDGITKTVTPFSVQQVLNGELNIVLKANDAVRIYNKYDLEEDRTVSIDGAVNAPALYPYFDNMTVEDLVIIANGFTDTANPAVIDVFRSLKDDNFETLTQSFKVSANNSLSLVAASEFKLMPKDRVAVRYLKGASELVVVTVSGEVNYPGSYSMERKDEKISDLLALSNGLSPYAFTEGATLIRKNPYYFEKALKLTTDEVVDNNKDEEDKKGDYRNNVVDIKNQEYFRVGINLQDIIDNPNAKSNLILLNDDELVVPSKKETVKIEGEVLVSSMVRYEKSSTLKDYISMSGGFSQNAKKNKTYVVYQNGDIASTKSFLFFKSYPKLEPGALILVPSKAESRNPLSTQDIIGISTGIATFTLLIDRLIK